MIKSQLISLVIKLKKVGVVEDHIAEVHSLALSNECVGFAIEPWPITRGTKVTLYTINGSDHELIF